MVDEDKDGNVDWNLNSFSNIQKLNISTSCGIFADQPPLNEIQRKRLQELTFNGNNYSVDVERIYDRFFEDALAHREEYENLDFLCPRHEILEVTNVELGEERDIDIRVEQNLLDLKRLKKIRPVKETASIVDELYTEEGDLTYGAPPKFQIQLRVFAP